MATHRRKNNRPGIKSKLQTIPGYLDWSNQSRNAGTLRKIENAIHQEKDLEEQVHLIDGNVIPTFKPKKPKYVLGIRGAFKDDTDYDESQYPRVDGFDRFAKDSETPDLD